MAAALAQRCAPTWPPIGVFAYLYRLRKAGSAAEQSGAAEPGVAADRPLVVHGAAPAQGACG
jgi:hypothetical protein